jgi:hypothetical protein
MDILQRSRISLHVGGDDVSSSRPYMALHAGTPQFVVADRYMQDHAPFRCHVSNRRCPVFLASMHAFAEPRPHLLAAMFCFFVMRFTGAFMFLKYKGDGANTRFM